jgi:hypothetical protein
MIGENGTSGLEFGRSLFDLGDMVLSIDGSRKT